MLGGISKRFLRSSSSSLSVCKPHFSSSSSSSVCLSSSRRQFSASTQHEDTPDNNANTPFEFTKESLEKAKWVISRYPSNYKASATMPLLFIAQEQNNNFLTLSAMNKVAEMLDIPPIRVYETASFYTMYNRKKVGKYHIQLCGTTPCMLCGAQEIKTAVMKATGCPGEATMSKDGLFTVDEVECLGACANAPMIQVNNHEFYENLTPENVVKLIDNWKAGRTNKVGPQNHQKTAEGPQGQSTLKDNKIPEFKWRDIDALLKEKAAKDAAAAAAPKK